jgi:predicted glycogen debranching enzyme
MTIHLPPRICARLPAALEREWLVTNGLGGFAAGTVAGALTRRYHGLLTATLQPPVGRRLLVVKLDETARAQGNDYALYTNIWQSGVEQPAGCRFLRRFDLEDGVPTWTFELGTARLVKQIWMEPGHNITFVRYELARAAPPLTLSCRLLVNDRYYHYLTGHGEREFHAEIAGPGLRITPPECGVPIQARCAGGAGVESQWYADNVWCRGFALPVEAGRGQDHVEDHLAIARCEVVLSPGTAVTFRFAAGADAAGGEHRALERQRHRTRVRLDEWAACWRGLVDASGAPLASLVLAADQFIVARRSPSQPDGHTVIAGYPWFTDWGRDTMISLPGLTLVTGRFGVARQILRTWASYVDRGLIPNRFPDEDDPAAPRPEYNTADAALWYIWAIDQYVRATGDVETLADLFPVMKDIIAWYRRGTRHNIRVAADGLVHAGEAGLNLTWMDAKIGARVITPRMGKPIELSALWYDGLCNLARLADLLGEPDAEYVRLAEVTRSSFQRFWNARALRCYDVLDGPDGNDARLRPNQIFAASLSHSPLVREQRAAVVQVCERKLLTWYGLRTLAPGEAGYRRRYAGGPVERDEAYHQGTVWAWLLGPFVLAHFRLYHDAARARRLLAPLISQLWAGTLGTLGEVFDAQEPFGAGGCFAQAWSVAEILRAWWITQQVTSP